MVAPQSLVEQGIRHYGRFARRPAQVNPLDEFAGAHRVLRRLRLKEWLGFTLIHPDWYSSLIIQDAHYLASSEIYAYDRGHRRLSQHAATARGGTLALPAALVGSRPCLRARGYRIEYDFGADEYRIRLDVAATSTAPAFRGELTLDARRASPPLSVSARLPGGRMYTHKAILPAHGLVRVGTDEIRFDAARDLAILDEHKSFLPYRTRWLWATFAVSTKDGLVGANLAQRPAIAGEQDESCLWAPDACEPLDGIRFHQPEDPDAAWRIASADGRVELTFQPEGRKQVRHQLGLFAIDYFQLYGQYRGTLRTGGRTYDIDGVPGVCESMRARL